MKRFTLCFLTLLIIAISSQAQQTNYTFKRLETDDGLSNGIIYTTLKDSRGFVWFGTDNGLNRFDSYEFKVYLHDTDEKSSIANNRVVDLEEDSQGNIWIGSDGGLSMYDPVTDKFTNYTSVPGGEGFGVNSLVIDQNDNVLAGTDNAGLLLLRKGSKSFEIFSVDSSTPGSIVGNQIYDMTQASPTTVWLSTNYGGMELFDLTSKTFKQFSFEWPKPIFSYGQKPVIIDRNGDVWVGTSIGVFKFQTSTQTFKRYADWDNGFNAFIVNGLYEDPQGKIWIGTDGGGISILDPTDGTYQYILSNPYYEKSLTSNAIYDIYEDNDGILWIGTYAAGVNVYNPKGSIFNNYESIPEEPSSLSLNNVLAIHRNNEGKIWVGTDRGGLNLFDPEKGTFQRFRHNPRDRQSISGDVIKSIYEDHEGTLWLGTYDAGLMEFSQKTNKVTRRFTNIPGDETSLAGKNIWFMTEDLQDRLWIGMLDEGLALMDRKAGTFQHFMNDPNDPNSIIGRTVKTMYTDSRGNLWLGMEWEGLNIFDPNTKKARRFTFSEESGSLINNDVRTILEDRDGKFWIGTSDGICLFNYDTESFTPFKFNDQLEGKVICAIQQDNQGNFWISTDKGISFYNPNKNGTVKNYSAEDGLQKGAFAVSAATKSE
ncbi:MAG: two-component regulator propeller domain-containing protein, partial [Bacteroidota bacterium]